MLEVIAASLACKPEDLQYYGEPVRRRDGSILAAFLIKRDRHFHFAAACIAESGYMVAHTYHADAVTAMGDGDFDRGALNILRPYMAEPVDPSPLQ